MYDVRNIRQPSSAEAAAVVQERIGVLRARVESLRLESSSPRPRTRNVRIGTALALAAAAAALVATVHGTGGSTSPHVRHLTSPSLGLGRIQDRFESGTGASTTRAAHAVHERHARRARVVVHTQAPRVVPTPATTDVGVASRPVVHAAAPAPAPRHGPASAPTGRRHTPPPAVSVGDVVVHVVEEPDPAAPTAPATTTTTTQELPQP